MVFTMTCKAKRVIEEVLEYDQLRRQKIKANFRKLESLGLPALMAMVLPVTNLKR